MSLFENCENCSKMATHVCKCSELPRFFCDSHTMNHSITQGDHSIGAALENLSPSEVSSVQDAYKNYRLSSVGQAILTKNYRIECLLQEIRRAEEEYSSMIETILGTKRKNIQEILSNQALPLFSQSPLVQSLLNLKRTSGFSHTNIQDLLLSLNSSLQTSSRTISSTQAPSLQTHLLSSVSAHASSEPLLSTQSFPSQIYITETVDPKNYRWELFQQKQAHSNWINSIAVSDCEKYIASASHDNTIKIWELQTLNLIRTLKGHTNWVTSVTFLGDKVVSGSEDTTIKIWEEDQCLSTLNLHSNCVNSVCVSACKRLIVSGSWDKTAKVYRLEDGKTLHTLSHSHLVYSVSLSSNDKEIVCGIMDGSIKIWKTETGELLKTLYAHSLGVTCAKYWRKFIVSSSRDKTVKIWDMGKNEALYLHWSYQGGM